MNSEKQRLPRPGRREGGRLRANAESGGKVSDTPSPAGEMPGAGAGTGAGPGRRDRLPLCPRPCPDATLRCSRTNGKVFPVFPSSWAPTTSPGVGSPLPPPLPTPFVFGFSSPSPRPPAPVANLCTPPPPPDSEAFARPTPPWSSLPPRSAGRSWPSARSWGGVRVEGLDAPSAGGGEPPPGRARPGPPRPRRRRPPGAQACASPARSCRQDETPARHFLPQLPAGQPPRLTCSPG